MIKFIIYEDNVNFLEKVQFIVNKVAMKDDFEYKIEKFTQYDPKLEEIMDDEESQKIYILDVEVPKVSGLELASRVRDREWNSMLIFVTSHVECKDDIFYSRLMALDFISKVSMFEERLEKTVRVAIDSFNKKKWFVFKYNQLTYRLTYDSINYIEKISHGGKSVIITDDGGQIDISMGLTKILELLDNRFYQTHKSCVVNVNNIKRVDSAINEIVFKNGEVIHWLSERNKKDFVNFVKNYKN